MYFILKSIISSYYLFYFKYLFLLFFRIKMNFYLYFLLAYSMKGFNGFHILFLVLFSIILIFLWFIMWLNISLFRTLDSKSKFYEKSIFIYHRIFNIIFKFLTITLLFLDLKENDLIISIWLSIASVIQIVIIFS